MEKKGISLLFLLFIIIVVIVFFVLLGKLIGNLNFNVKGNSKLPKFSISTLESAGFLEDYTKDNLKEKFSDLKLKSSYIETKSGKLVEEYYSDKVKVRIKDRKIDTIIVDQEKYSFAGIKIGNSVNKLKKIFCMEKDDNVEIKDELVKEFLYGNYTIENLEEMKISDVVQYAYIGNEKTGSNDFDYCVEYVYMEPDYKEEFASKKDKIYILEFGIKNNKIARIAYQIQNNE